MKAVLNIVVIVGAIMFLYGCTDTTSVPTAKHSFDLKQRHIVKHYKNAYYYRPNYAWSYKLNKNHAHINNVTSGGILKCKENDIWFISTQDRAEEQKIRYRYFISLSKSQLEDIKDDAIYIPRENSEEFKELIEIDTQMAKKGLIGCSSQISKRQLEKILPMSDVVAVPLQ